MIPFSYDRAEPSASRESLKAESSDTERLDMEPMVSSWKIGQPRRATVSMTVKIPLMTPSVFKLAQPNASVISLVLARVTTISPRSPGLVDYA